MKKTVYLLLIILVLSSLGQMASDLYLPSLPAISSELTSSLRLVQWSVSAFMIGFSLSQLIYGPVSDGIGRKAPLIFGLILLMIGCLMSYLAYNILGLILGRLIQGIGAGSSVTLTRAMLRDTYSGATLAKYGSFIGVGSVALMTSAPMLGGYIQSMLGWRAQFSTLGIYTFLLLLLVLFTIPETNNFRHHKHLSLTKWRENLHTIFTNPVFLGLSCIIFVSYAGVLAWLTVSPRLLQVVAHFSPVEYGWTVFFTGAMFCIGGYANGLLVPHFGIRRMIRLGLLLMGVGAIVMWCFLLTTASVSLLTVVIPMGIYITGTGFIYANAYSGSMTPFPKIAGVASSVFSFIQILGGALASALMAHFSQPTQKPLILLLTGAIILGGASYLMIQQDLKSSH